MKRFRLSTLMLLVVIVGLSFMVVMQQIRTARLVAELEARRATQEKLHAIDEARLEIMKAVSKAFDEANAEQKEASDEVGR